MRTNRKCGNYILKIYVVRYTATKVMRKQSQDLRRKKQTNKTFIQTFEGLFVISGLEFERNFGQTYNAKMTKSGVQNLPRNKNIDEPNRHYEGKVKGYILSIQDYWKQTTFTKTKAQLPTMSKLKQIKSI